MVETSPSTARRAGWNERLELLEGLASSGAAAACLDEQFQLCAVPEAIAAMGFEAIGAEALDGYSRPLAAIAESDRPRAMLMVDAARTVGIARSDLRFLPDAREVAPRTVHVVDAREMFGVYVITRGGSSERSDAHHIEASPPRRLVHRRNESAVIEWVDEGTERLLGWQPSDMIGKTALEFVHPDDHDRAIRGWLQMLAGAETERVRVRYRSASGEHRWFEVRNTNRLDDADGPCIETELIDVHEEMLALAAARDSEAQFEALTEALPVGVVHLEPDGSVTFSNRWLHRLIGENPDRWKSAVWVHPHDRRTLEGAVEESIQTGASVDCEVRLRDGIGSVHSTRWRVRPLAMSEGRLGALASVEDMTEGRQLQEMLRRQAESDALTGLPNRRALQEWIEARSADHSVAVFFIDLDGFKLVNDSLGHDAGDALLKHVARLLTRSVRPDDLVARVGGDEFVLVCPGVPSEAAAATIANRVVEAFASPLIIDDVPVLPGCSIGIALSPDRVLDADHLLGNADIAMYEAKRDGGMRWSFFEEELRAGAERRFQLERDLRSGVGAGQFELFLQPIVHLPTMQRIGAEALVRWNHPDLGLLTPNHFIPLAERCGAIVPLGRWILEEACAIGARMSDSVLPQRIAVNISGRQLAEPGFVDAALSVLQRSDLGNTQVVLEVTETVFLEMNENVVMALRDLCDAGAVIALDDFGTGFSSLNHLRHMPARIVKIDRSYTADLGMDEGTTAIMETMVQLTERLGQEIVAEGIETDEQLDLLLGLGITIGQGYLLDRPMPVGAFFDSDAPRSHRSTR